MLAICIAKQALGNTSSKNGIVPATTCTTVIFFMFQTSANVSVQVPSLPFLMTVILPSSVI